MIELINIKPCQFLLVNQCSMSSFDSLIALKAACHCLRARANILFRVRLFTVRTLGLFSAHLHSTKQLARRLLAKYFGHEEALRHAQLNFVAVGLQFDCVYELLHSRTPAGIHSPNWRAWLGILRVADGASVAADSCHNPRRLLLQFDFSLLNLFLLVFEDLEELLSLYFVGLLLTDGALFRLGHRKPIRAHHSSLATAQRVEYVVVSSKLAKIGGPSHNADRLRR
mmetsp:Transcript_17580/g.23739  ORF Transcript_17580/g.23739 Transcript_17580/m.23739 type:complete len:226 (-) Transcript_17580:649-1326(-)